jgi:hypothetical protein
MRPRSVVFVHLLSSERHHGFLQPPTIILCSELLNDKIIDSEITITNFFAISFQKCISINLYFRIIE